PTVDARVGYRYAPRGEWRATADAWLRRYVREAGLASYAGGADAGIERALGAWRGRLDGLWDDGWGGRRVGGTAEAAWRDRKTWLRGRVIVLGVRQDDVPIARAFVTGSTVASATWRVADTVAVHAIAEVDYDAIHSLQTRGIAVFDLAFAPEP